METFEVFKKNYESINRKCGIYNHYYNLRNDIIVKKYCKQWVCDRCRKRLKNLLFSKVVENVEKYNLDRHFVITCDGNDFRESVSWFDSYDYVSKAWNKFRKVIRYKYGNLSYISFPRAQKDGYCHYHVLIDRFVDWDFLDKKRKSYGLGFVSIMKNNNVVDYLRSDFFKDSEYYIPLNKRHFNSSNNISLIDRSVKDEFFEVDNALLINVRDPYSVINEKFGRCLPYEEYVKRFYSIVS